MHLLAGFRANRSIICAEGLRALTLASGGVQWRRDGLSPAKLALIHAMLLRLARTKILTFVIHIGTSQFGQIGCGGSGMVTNFDQCSARHPSMPPSFNVILTFQCQRS